MRMTIDELLAWKHGKLEDYEKLIARKKWIEARIAGAYNRRLDAIDSMGVFGEDEHNDPLYLKYKESLDKAEKDIEHYQSEYAKVAEQLVPYMAK